MFLVLKRALAGSKAAEVFKEELKEKNVLILCYFIDAQAKRIPETTQICSFTSVV